LRLSIQPVEAGLSAIPHEGDRLGRFEIIRRLGKGGMGIVYLARDTSLDTEVVLKLLLPNMTAGGDIDRFKRELLVARRISHPAVCRLFDIHEEEGFHFISMEYIQGKTLQDVIRDEGPLEVERALRLILAALDGVAAAHDIDIIHRDLKPGNIMVAKDDKVSILDFGLSKALDLASITVTNVRVGTVQYMSPEVFQNNQANLQSDLYSLGVVLYECLTKHLPFKGYDMVSIGKAAAAGNWLPPRVVNPDIPPAVEKLMSRALEPSPQKRFKSTGDFKKAVSAVLAEIAPPKTDSPPPPPDRDSKIEDSVLEVFGNPSYSEVLRARVRNTTILFSDIVAITEYFEKHGDVSGTKRIQCQNDLLFPVVKRYKGEVIKTVGDAIMACFDTAEDGVGAAIGMQRALEKYNESLKESEEKLNVRIGLNSGESIFESRDIFGDVVNVAARICAQAQGGQILISTATRETLHPERHPTTFHSKVTLKGKSIPQKLYAVHWGPDLLEEPELTGAQVPRPALTKQPAAGLFSKKQLLVIAGGALTGLLAVIIAFALSSSGDNPSPTPPEPLTAPVTSKDIVPVPGDSQPSSQSEGARVPDPVAAPEPLPEPEPETDPLLAESDLEPEPVVLKTNQPKEYIKKYQSLRKSIRIAMRKKGIITGDNPRLDLERRKMRSLWKKSRHQAALKAGRRARSLLKKITVDRALVKSKLLRFNRLFDQIGDAGKKRMVSGLARKIMEAYDSGKYRDANDLLNRAIRIMKTS
jgi:serine/threonine protein kinase